MGVNGEALQLHAVYKKPYFFTASHTRIRISTTSHVSHNTAACNNTDSNRVVIFSGIALYYGDNDILNTAM